MKRLMVVAVLALGVGGCVTEGRIKAKYNQLESAWRVDNAMPSATPLPVDVGVKLSEEAKTQVETEVVAERKALVGAAGKAVAGDYIGGFLALLGIGTSLLAAKG